MRTMCFFRYDMDIFGGLLWFWNLLGFHMKKDWSFFNIFYDISIAFYISLDRIHLLLEPFRISMYGEFIIWGMNSFWDKIYDNIPLRNTQEHITKISCINLLHLLKLTKFYHKQIKKYWLFDYIWWTK